MLLGLKQFLTGRLNFHFQSHTNVLYLRSQINWIYSHISAYHNFGRYIYQHSPTTARWDMEYRHVKLKQSAPAHSH